MNKFWPSARFLVLALVTGTSFTLAGTSPSVGPGARIFVTKCYPGHGLLTPADFAQLADAGFTVVVDMWKADLTAFVRNAAVEELDVLTWNMGQEDADTWGQPRTVTRVGLTTRYCVPSNNVGWWVIEQNLLNQARMSLTNPNLKGAVLDFEIYDPNKTDGYCESYDDQTWSGFFTSRGSPVPSIAAAQRWNYLKNQNLLAAYIQYNVTLVGQQVLIIRQSIDTVNPRFQIGIYGWGSLIDTVKRNLATTTAPVLDFDAGTYGRSVWQDPAGYSPDTPDRPGLKWSLINNARGARSARNQNYPVIFLGGHYPQAPGPLNGTGSEQYKFTVRQAFNSAVYADGYWIWTDWVAPPGWVSKQAWIDAMMAYWKWSNAALEAEDYAWAGRQLIQIADPNGTQPQIILTKDTQDNVTAWNPLTGNRVTIDQNPNPAAWTLSTQGDVDACAGVETVSLDTTTGYIAVQDPATQVVVSKFLVGSDQTAIQLIQADILSEPVSIHGTVLGYNNTSTPLILELSQNNQVLRTSQVFLTAQGQFTLELISLPAGLYDLTINAQGRQVKLANIPVLGNPTEIGTVVMIAGDANGDDKVDVGDLGILAAHYGTTTGATLSMGDFNGDGAVDVGDLGILAANYGTGATSAQFVADYSKIFSSTVRIQSASTDDAVEESSNSACIGLGWPLLAGLGLMSWTLVKLEN
jgi:hypothetical protein